MLSVAEESPACKSGPFLYLFLYLQIEDPSSFVVWLCSLLGGASLCSPEVTLRVPLCSSGEVQSLEGFRPENVTDTLKGEFRDFTKVLP